MPAAAEGHAEAQRAQRRAFGVAVAALAVLFFGAVEAAAVVGAVVVVFRLALLAP